MKFGARLATDFMRVWLFFVEQTQIAPKAGACYNYLMRIISRRTLRQFWERHPDSEQPLRAWYTDAKHASWKTPSDVKHIYRNASILANNRIVFNIKGNKYRLIVSVHYKSGIVYIRFIGTHAEYDRVDAATI